MPDQTEVIRSVTTETEPGYPRTTDSVVLTTKSRKRAMNAREQIVANQAGYRADAMVHLPFGTDVRPDDRLRIDGHVYEVRSVNTETSAEFKAHVEATVSRTG